MRKDALVELVEDFLVNNAPDDLRRRYHLEIIAAWIALVWEKMYAAHQKSGVGNAAAFSATGMIITVNATVIKDQATWVLYIKDVKPIMGVNGLIQISDDCGSNVNIIMGAVEKAITDLLICGNGDEVIYQNSRIEFTRAPKKKNYVVYMVPDFMSLPDDFDLAFPNGMGEDIAVRVLEILSAKDKTVTESVNDQKIDEK
jgi:hypothetical protein